MGFDNLASHLFNKHNLIEAKKTRLIDSFRLKQEILKIIDKKITSLKKYSGGKGLLLELREEIENVTR
jgi:hypothetical protein